MTEQERHAGITALSRLIAELLTDENFLAFVKQRTGRAPTTATHDQDGRLPSEDKSS